MRMMQTAVMMKRVAPLLLLLLKVSSTSCFDGRLLLQYEGSNGSDQSPAASGPGMANPSGNLNPPVNITQIIQAVRTAEHEPEPHMITLRAEMNAGGSTISVGESYAAGTLAVQFRFNSCSGTQLHHHSNLEFMQGVIGSLHVGVIFPNGTLLPFNFTAGQAVVIPSGFIHYYLNRGCEPSIMVATWPAGTKTTFELAALSAVPPAILGDVFATTRTVPRPQPGFPIIRDPDCLQRCGINGTLPAQG